MTQLQIGDGDGANEDMPIGLMRRTGTMRRTWSTRRTGPTRCKLRRMKENKLGNTLRIQTLYYKVKAPG